jgi:ABC-type sugar transport system ATPase subunit
MSETVVEMRNIKKTFGPTRALKGVDLTIQKGEVHALLGRNGAGKSTLVSALSGFVPSDSGTIRVKDLEIETGYGEYADRIRERVAHVQQTPRMFDLLTVAENLFIGNRGVQNRWGFIHHDEVTRRARELITEWKIDIPAEASAGSLSAESRQLLEIVKALARGVPIIILDEPTAALSNAEKEILYSHVKKLKERDVSFIYISHHLEEVFEVADVVTILRDGQVVLAREPVDRLDIQRIASLMVGEEVVRSSRVHHGQDEESPVLEVKDLRIGSRFDPAISFHVRPGEILALGGPVGSGKEDLGMILAGHQKPHSGTVTVKDGKPPGYVPTDRHQSGYVGILSIRENITLGGLDVLTDGFGFVQGHKEEARIQGLIRATDVIASSPEQAVMHLSGGNQQKVVFARALCRDPKVIVALSPTRGVDVGAKEQLYQLLRKLAAQGIGIVVVSDEHEEIDQIANRVLIVFENDIVATLEGDYSIEDLVIKMEGVT